MPRFTEDRRRAGLNNEVHARPFAALEAPERISHLAVLYGDGGAEADRLHLAALCDSRGVAPPPPDATHFAAEFGAFRLKWERHSEFSTYSFLRGGHFDDPFADPAIARVPQDWLKQLPGAVLVAAHLALLPADPPNGPKGTDDAGLVARTLAPDTACGSLIAGGGAMAWTDFRLHEDGFGRILVRDIRLTPAQAGRMMQRLLEIETYRMTALLALPAAREHAPAIDRIGAALAKLTGDLACVSGLDAERRLLDALVQLSAEAERIAAATTYRFGAGRAYYALVRRRIEELREQRVEGLQSVGEFMDRRLAPAMRTCESVGERLEAIAARLARVGALLRARVDVALEAQNRDLLASMNRRAQVQLRLQQTVEGLSVAAITYYVVGLVAYLAKAAKGMGSPLDPDLAAGLAILPVAASVWLAVRRLRRRLKGD